jgi:hypothetical protein
VSSAYLGWRNFGHASPVNSCVAELLCNGQPIARVHKRILGQGYNLRYPFDDIDLRTFRTVEAAKRVAERHYRTAIT